MGNAYGFVEITGVVAATDALDIMCKTADVTLATWERKLGGRLVTLEVRGDVSAVTQAVEAARTGAIKKPVACGVIANPHPEIIRLIGLSASRFMPPPAQEDATDDVNEKTEYTQGADPFGGGPIFR